MRGWRASQRLNALGGKPWRRVQMREKCAELGVSRRQLNRLFKARVGSSTMAYYRDLRLDKALNLVRNSPLSLTEIALATGFSSSAHFSRICTRRHGLPPSAFRR